MNPKELTCGVPQGSPISPLISLSYKAELMRSGNILEHFSYADDIGILYIGHTVRQSAIIA